MCVCVCVRERSVCVCVRERERERVSACEREWGEGGGKRGLNAKLKSKPLPDLSSEDFSDV